MRSKAPSPLRRFDKLKAPSLSRGSAGALEMESLG
jgi:hypothetical protein